MFADIKVTESKSNLFPMCKFLNLNAEVSGRVTGADGRWFNQRATEG
jgi:hypothetical protein